MAASSVDRLHAAARRRNRVPIIARLSRGACCCCSRSAMYLYDHSRRDVIANGVKIDGVSVGGLHAAAAHGQARARARRAAEPAGDGALGLADVGARARAKPRVQGRRREHGRPGGEREPRRVDRLADVPRAVRRKRHRGRSRWSSATRTTPTRALTARVRAAVDAAAAGRDRAAERERPADSCPGRTEGRSATPSSARRSMRALVGQTPSRTVIVPGARRSSRRSRPPSWRLAIPATSSSTAATLPAALLRPPETRENLRNRRRHGRARNARRACTRSNGSRSTRRGTCRKKRGLERSPGPSSRPARPTR